MKQYTFEELIPRATSLFYKVWIDEGTPQECEFYKEYFTQYPNKGNYTEFYNKALKKAVNILFTSFEYETPERITTPAEFLRIIEQEEAANAQYL